MVALDLVTIGIMLIFIGFIIVMLSIILAAGRSSRVEGGGVIIIGPIPIVFGTNRNITVLLLVLAIILTVLTIVLFIAPLITYRGIP